MNLPPLNRNNHINRSMVFGAGIATALMTAILIFTGGHQETPALRPAPVGEAPLPMLDGVNQPANQATNETTPKSSESPNAGQTSQ